MRTFEHSIHGYVARTCAAVRLERGWRARLSAFPFWGADRGRRGGQAGYGHGNSFSLFLPRRFAFRAAARVAGTRARFTCCQNHRGTIKMAELIPMTA